MTPKNTLVAVFLGLLALLTSPSLHAVDPPGILNHQGSVLVNGTKYNGPFGYFKFVLYDADLNAAVWWNSDLVGNEPGSPVAVLVENGNYAVALGDVTLANMKVIPPSVFTDHANVRLRIWFSTAFGGPFQLLSPDRRVAPAGYAFSAGQLGEAVTVNHGSGQVDVNGPANFNYDGSQGVKIVRPGTDPNLATPAELIFDRTTAGADHVAAVGYDPVFDGYFVWANGVRMVVRQDTGNVGIGTTSPTAPLHVVGQSPQNLGGHYLLWAGSPAGTGGGIVSAPPGSSTPLTDVAILSSGAIVAWNYRAISDVRIKTVEGRSDGASDLDILREIEVADYTYKDAIGRGTRPQKKVIAQQVETVYPQAVSQSTDVVPDIYRPAPIGADGWVTLATGLKVGEHVKLIGETVEGIHEVLEVRDGAFRTACRPEDGQNKVFVYGREVDDFRTVDYEAISMLNVSATQELHRQLEAEKAKNAALEKRLAALEAKDALRDAKLTRIEKLLGNGDTKLVSLESIGSGK